MTPTSAAPKRLLFIVNDAGFFLSHRLNIARAARKAGWIVDVATPAGPKTQRVLEEGFAHHPIPLSRSGANLFQELRTLFALWRLFRGIRPALVHAITIKPVLYSGFVAPLAGVPALVHAVSGLGHIFVAPGRIAAARRHLVHLAYRAAFRHKRSRVIFQNPDDQNALERALREGQAALIPGAGVDIEKFAPQPLPQGEDAPVVVLASRMLWAKGVGEFVACAQKLRARGAPARLVLVGESDPGNPAAVPEAQLIDWSKQGEVEWWGHRDDMAEVFATATVICLPTYYGEGIPKVLIEAAACGRPIVATDWPGCREIVRNGENGFLVPPRDPEALAESLTALLESRPLCEKMGQRGREMVVERFTTQHIERLTLAVYRSLAVSAEDTSMNT